MYKLLCYFLIADNVNDMTVARAIVIRTGLVNILAAAQSIELVGLTLQDALVGGVVTFTVRVLIAKLLG